MNDNNVRALQWQRLVGEYFVPLLGGSPEPWSPAKGVGYWLGRLYGPDLIDTLKVGPEYYERIFADLGIAAAEALVVDDSPRATRWATQVGARAALVGDSPLPQTGTTVHIGSLVELPATLQRLD